MRLYLKTTIYLVSDYWGAQRPFLHWVPTGHWEQAGPGLQVYCTSLYSTGGEGVDFTILDNSSPAQYPPVHRLAIHIAWREVVTGKVVKGVTLHLKKDVHCTLNINLNCTNLAPDHTTAHLPGAPPHVLGVVTGHWTPREGTGQCAVCSL